MNPSIPQFLNNIQLLEVLSSTDHAVAVHVGEKFIIQYASNTMLKYWGKGKYVIGKPLEEALPELRGQAFIDLFTKVWKEGVTISGKDTLAKLYINGELQDFYFDFEYRAIKNEQGETCCILHSAKDVTERVQAKQREQDLNEELTVLNEELSAANEELMASNEELMQSQKDLQETYEELIESDSRFRNMVRQAPVGMCVILAEDLRVQDVNDAYLELVGKKRAEIENLAIWDAIPEAAATYAPILNNVIVTGVPFYATEHELTLIRNGVPEKVFVDFVYEPIRHTDGTVNAIMVLAIEVTEKVVARRSIEEVEERIRLAVEAAEIGTFDLDLITGVTLTSDRFNAIFGFDQQVSWDKFIAVIHPDDNEKRLKAHQQAYKTGKIFYEVRVIYEDGSVHWIRVQGKVYYDANKKPVRILGTLLDITKFKRLEQQKDDFISIASHELKTPITSLKASLQLLDKIKENPSPVLLPKLVEQANRSMEKITTLVNDLLNVSRTNDTELRLNKTIFTIANLLNNCCNHIRVLGKYKLTIQGDEQLQVFADEHAIDQVVVNLVNNAVKYAPDSLEIFMNIEKLGDIAKISIIDTGPGISADKLPHLFDRYYQAETSGFQNSGLGLGLYICAEIIKRHNGKIGVDSEPGKGSNFWFTLPLTGNI